jgi:hypothetical protein
LDTQKFRKVELSAFVLDEYGSRFEPDRGSGLRCSGLGPRAQENKGVYFTVQCTVSNTPLCCCILEPRP